jgi:uncharacterized membrane protein (UPF0127 family)
MSKNLTISLIILIAIPIVIFFFYKKPSSKFETVNLKIKNIDYKLEIAKSISQKSAGLSKRTKLCSNCGMIFIFSNLAPRYFWMKNTLIPLDMLFLDQNGVINTIHTAVPEPNTSDLKLKIYSSLAPAKYVIEIPSGRAQELGLKIGSQINLESITK